MKFFHTITVRFAFALAALLLVGGSIANAQWEAVNTMPVNQDLWGFASAFYNGKIYTFGGVTAGSTQITNSTYALDITAPTPAWQTSGSMFAATYFASAATLNNRIYVFGGQNGNQALSNFFNTASSLDPATGSFRQEPAMPRTSMSAAAVAVGNKAFVIGGIRVNAAQTGLEVTQAMLVFDATSNTWTEVATGSPYLCYGQMATVIGNTIYMAGGQAPNGAGYTVAYKGTVNGNNITWTQIADLPAVIASGGMSAFHGKPMIAGGISTAEGFRGAYVYDEAKNKWDSYYQLPTIHASGALVGDGTTPYMIAGSGTNEVLKATQSEAKAVASVTGTQFHVAMKTGDTKTLKISVQNLGVVDLNASLQVGGTTPWITSTPITVAPGATQVLTANINAATLAEGRYPVSVSVATNDPDNASIPVTIDVWVLNNLAHQESKAVLEEAHGTWCPPCGSYGVPAVADLLSTYGERMIVISNHDKGGTRYDPFSTTAGETLNGRLQLNAYPTGSVQRGMKNGSHQLSAGAEWQQAVAAVFEESEYAKANIDISDYSFDPNSREVSGKITVTTAAPILWTAGSTLRVTAVVTESGYSYTQQFATEAAHVIEHNHFARAFWPSIDGQAISLGSDATVDAGTVLKPGLSYTVPFTFTVPASTTPTSSGDISSLPVTPDKCNIVFLVHVNDGTTLGPILGADEMKLVQGSVGPAISVNFPTVTTKSIDPQTTAQFEVSVTNNRSEPVEITINRAQNDMPSGWTSEICTGASDCDDAGTVNFSIPANGTHAFTLKVNGATAGATGTVRLVFQAGDILQDKTFTVNTSVSGVAVTGEAGGLSMTEITPNPASTVTHINLTIPTGSQTILEVYSVTGQKVATLFEGRLEAGNRQIDANVSSLESGKYVLVLTSGDKKVSRTLTIVR